MLSKQVMNEEILPACERLRREKGQYMEWQAENAKLDSLRRFCVAFRYVEAQRCADWILSVTHASYVAMACGCSTLHSPTTLSYRRHISDMGLQK